MQTSHQKVIIGKITVLHHHSIFSASKQKRTKERFWWMATMASLTSQETNPSLEEVSGTHQAVTNNLVIHQWWWYKCIEQYFSLRRWSGIVEGYLKPSNQTSKEKKVAFGRSSCCLLSHHQQPWHPPMVTSRYITPQSPFHSEFPRWQRCGGIQGVLYQIGHPVQRHRNAAARKLQSCQESPHSTKEYRNRHQSSKFPKLVSRNDESRFWLERKDIYQLWALTLPKTSSDSECVLPWSRLSAE